MGYNEYGGIKNYKGTYPKQFTLLSGEKREADDPAVIACCTSVSHHHRFLTIEDIREHQCFFKKCMYLRKLPGNAFWEIPQKEYTSQTRRYFSTEGTRFLQYQKRKWKEEAERKCSLIEDFCENWVKENALDGKFKVTSVRPFDNSTKNFRLFYVSSQSCYDAPDYLELVSAIQMKFRWRVKLVHIKDVNGHRLTISEYDRIK